MRAATHGYNEGSIEAGWLGQSHLPVMLNYVPTTISGLGPGARLQVAEEEEARRCHRHGRRTRLTRQASLALAGYEGPGS